MTDGQMSDAPGYIDRLITILRTVVETQSHSLDRTAQLCAGALEQENLVHFFGSGHSVIPVMDAFPRYGSFAGLNPLIDPRLLWYNVFGAGGLGGLQWLENSEGYVPEFLKDEPLIQGDVLICYSHGGTNAAPIDAALFARQRGASTVAVTAASHARTSQHSSGNRLVDVCDVIVDTCCPLEDAIVPVSGWPAPTGGSATAVQVAVTQEIISRTAVVAAGLGFCLPTLANPTVPGVTNEKVLDEYRRRLRQAEDRAQRAEKP